MYEFFFIETTYESVFVCFSKGVDKFFSKKVVYKNKYFYFYAR